MTKTYFWVTMPAARTVTCCWDKMKINECMSWNTRETAVIVISSLLQSCIWCDVDENILAGITELPSVKLAASEKEWTVYAVNKTVHESLFDNSLF